MIGTMAIPFSLRHQKLVFSHDAANGFFPYRVGPALTVLDTLVFKQKFGTPHTLLKRLRPGRLGP